jgi:hypothetical protein
MKGYLEGIIKEQIDRGKYLRSLIPFPLPYPEIASLASNCTRIIDENVSELNGLLEYLSRDEENLDYVYRRFRDCVRYLQLVEYYGVSALCYHKSPHMEYLNKLIFKIPQEINLPLPSPAVACISNSYYYISPFTNVIFVPIGESNFLLHLPDVFHEIGHEVLYHKEGELRIQKIQESYNDAIRRITEYYSRLLTIKVREIGPSTIPQTIIQIHSKWKNYWMDEIFADLFACYTLGPAYVWAHLHLVTKTSEDVYTINMKHPSDDSRMKILLIGLKKLGFINEATKIEAQWQRMPFIVDIYPVNEYQYAYPEELLNEIAEIVLHGIRQSGFFIISPSNLSKLQSDSIIKLLNNAWTQFWVDPIGFRQWEEASIKQLKSLI